MGQLKEADMLARISLLIAALSLIVATVSVGFAVSAAAPDSFRPAGTTRYAVASGSASAYTKSLSWVDIPDLATSITVPAGMRADVFVDFCAVAYTVNADDDMAVRALVGASTPTPSEMLFHFVTVDWESQCATFERLNVPEGTRTVHMQWRGSITQGGQYMSSRNMIVTANIHN